MKNSVCGKTFLMLAVVCCGGMQQDLQAAALLPYVARAVSFFRYKEVPADCNETRLTELLWQGDYGRLSAYIDAAMQSGDGAVQTMVATWMREYEDIEIPLLMYKIARNTVSDAATLAKTGKGMRSSARDEIVPTLVQLIKFCLYYYIDSVVCLRSVAKMPDNQAMYTGTVDAYAELLGGKAAEIFERTHDKWKILMHAQGSREDYFPAVVEEVRRVWSDGTYRASAMLEGPSGHIFLRERVHSAPWVFGVTRDIHWGTTAYRAAKGVMGHWLPAEEPGGIDFSTPDSVYHHHLGLVPDAELLKWYQELQVHALMSLESYATVNEFFAQFSVRGFLGMEAVHLKADKRRRAGSGSVVEAAQGAGGEPCEDEDSASVAGSSHSLPLAPRHPGIRRAVSAYMPRVPPSSPQTPHSDPTHSAAAQRVKRTSVLSAERHMGAFAPVSAAASVAATYAAVPSSDYVDAATVFTDSDSDATSSVSSRGFEVVDTLVGPKELTAGVLGQLRPAGDDADSRQSLSGSMVSMRGDVGAFEFGAPSPGDEDAWVGAMSLQHALHPPVAATAAVAQAFDDDEEGGFVGAALADAMPHLSLGDGMPEFSMMEPAERGKAFVSPAAKKDTGKKGRKKRK